MNSNVPESTARYEKLAKPKPRIDRNRNFNPFEVKREALSYQITDSINKLAKPKKDPSVNPRSVSSTSAKTDSSNRGHHKLINSNAQARDAQESRKKEFLLDSYARITAARNKRCSKRLLDLAKPKYTSRVQDGQKYDDIDYFRVIKKYDPKFGLASVSQTNRKNTLN